MRAGSKVIVFVLGLPVMNAAVRSFSDAQIRLLGHWKPDGLNYTYIRPESLSAT